MIYNTETAWQGFNETGETWLLKRLAHCNLTTIFDVGCNQGEWTKLARSIFPKANIYSFEIMPETYRRFLTNVDIDTGIIPNSFGLSAITGTIPMKYCATNDYLNTHLEKMSPGTVADMPYEWRNCLCVRGDDYVTAHKISNIDILKIDVEGAEHLVLEGLHNTINNGKVGLIQFEYGTANIISRWLLADAYELLTPLGYVMGRLESDKIIFQPYNLGMENFIGPNFVAVHQNRTDILTSLI